MSEDNGLYVIDGEGGDTQALCVVLCYITPDGNMSTELFAGKAVFFEDSDYSCDIYADGDCIFSVSLNYKVYVRLMPLTEDTLDELTDAITEDEDPSTSGGSPPGSTQH